MTGTADEWERASTERPAPATNDATMLERLAAEVVLESLTDLGNAKRLARRFSDELRYVARFGRWYVWDGARWRPDDTGEALRRCCELSRLVLAEAATVEDKKERAAFTKWATASQMNRAVVSAMHLARAREELATRHEAFDQHPMLLNAPNGTINLARGELRPHDRAELHSKMTGVAFDPSCPTPRWHAFLEQVLPDSAVRAFVQRSLGYSASGDCGEHVFFLPHGGGQNGKTTLLNVVQSVLGDYADQAAPDLLLARKHDAHPTEIAELVGKRFVSATEARSGRRLDDAMTKRVTGGDPLRAHFMRQDNFTFLPTHKLWLAVNSLPRVDDASHAMWRRIRRVPFEVQIDPAQRVNNLDQVLVAEEGPGILAWLVEGAAAWAAGGLATPFEVELATESYRVDEDHVAQFFEDRLVFDIGFTATSAALRTEYESWAADSAVGDRQLVSPKVMGERLGERGCRGTKVKACGKQSRGWRGVGLASEARML